MFKNTVAVAVFSDSFDDEPTVSESFARLAGDSLPPAGSGSLLARCPDFVVRAVARRTCTETTQTLPALVSL